MQPSASASWSLGAAERGGELRRVRGLPIAHQANMWVPETHLTSSTVTVYVHVEGGAATLPRHRGLVNGLCIGKQADGAAGEDDRDADEVAS